MLAGDSGTADLAGNPWPSRAELVRLSGHVRRRLPRVRAPCLVVHSTDDDIARRCKSAVEKWKFNPATAPDDRVVEARIEVPFKFPAGAK